MSKKIFDTSWYVIVFAVYPVTAMFAHNLAEIEPFVIFRPLLLIVLIAVVLFLIARYMYHDDHRAAFAVTLFLLLFFSYGHVRIALRAVIPSVPTLWFFALWLVIMTSAFLAAGRNYWDFSRATPSFNIMAVVMIAGPLFELGAYVMQRSEPLILSEDHSSALVFDDQPDIYYIILDSYARSDLLEENLGYDNRDFLDELRSMNFYIADCSQSNYANTGFSLASSLNMDYLPALSLQFTPDQRNITLLHKAIQDNVVIRSLDAAGYSIVTYSTGFSWLDIRNVDQHIEPQLSIGLTSFEIFFLRTTLFLEADTQRWLDLTAAGAEQYRTQTLTALNSIDHLAETPSPRFVYMHLIVPHPPFIFGADGSPVDVRNFMNEDGFYTMPQYMAGYTMQSEFISARILQTIRQVMQISDAPPVIVIQGDHGLRFQDPNRGNDILNAYYIPGHDDMLYPSISPVNTFRLIFNAYFDQQYEMLPDTAYISSSKTALDFQPIPPSCAKP